MRPGRSTYILFVQLIASSVLVAGCSDSSVASGDAGNNALDGGGLSDAEPSEEDAGVDSSHDAVDSDGSTDADAEIECSTPKRNFFQFRANSRLTSPEPRIHPSFPGPCKIERLDQNNDLVFRFTFEYSDNGLLEQMDRDFRDSHSKDDTSITRTYDEIGRLIESRQDFPDSGGDQAVWEHIYDDQGRRIEDRVTSNLEPSQSRDGSLRYQYDACGRIVEIGWDRYSTGELGLVKRLEYRSGKLREIRTYRDNDESTEAHASLSYSYDSSDRLDSVESRQWLQTEETVRRWEFSYDEMNRRATVQRYAGEPPELSSTDSYHYERDNSEDLTKISLTDKRGDPVGALHYDYSCW